MLNFVSFGAGLVAGPKRHIFQMSDNFLLGLLMRETKMRDQGEEPMEDALHRYRDSCTSRRATADLLRWSMGSEPRQGDGFSGYADYKAPKNPAKPSRSVKETVAQTGRAIRGLSLWTLAGFLRWALSFGDDREQRKS